MRDPEKSVTMKRIFECFMFAAVICGSVYCFDADLTIDIGPGRRECFHQTVKKGQAFEIEYQVIDGGDLDIDVFVHDPRGGIQYSERRKSDGVHKITATDDGDYAFCLDNSFSHFSKKLVFFEIVSEGDDDNDLGAYGDLATDENPFGIKLEDIRSTLGKIKHQLEKTQELQNDVRIVEARDRSFLEDNFERVNFWSGVQLFVMVTVGLTQLLMVRSLFEDRGKLKKLATIIHLRS